MNKSKPRKNYEMRSRRRDDLTLALIVFLLALAYMASVSCVSLKRSGDEPEWLPDIYKPVLKEGKCMVVSGNGHKVQCDEPMFFDFYCAPLDDIVRMKSKLQQCEAWR